MSTSRKNRPEFEGPVIWAKVAGIAVRLTPPTSRLTGERAVRWAKAWARRHPNFPLCVWVSPNESLWIRPGAETGWYSRAEDGAPALPGLQVGRKKIDLTVSGKQKRSNK